MNPYQESLRFISEEINETDLTWHNWICSFGIQNFYVFSLRIGFLLLVKYRFVYNPGQKI